jgi:uncharacterized protein (DUF1697 family)
MTAFVVLLRGINFGRGPRVPMVELRALLTELGYGDVQTLLNSGNAVFRSRARSTTTHATRIRTALSERLGVDVAVIVKSAAEFTAIQADNPLAPLATDPARLLVAVPGERRVLADLASLAPLVAKPEQMHIGRQALYLWCPDGLLASRAASALLAKSAHALTTRNWATILKLDKLLQGLPQANHAG